MAFNKSELILDKVRNLVAKDLSTDKILFRLTSLEDPSLQCTAEGEEVTDAIGSVITTMYRAKKATFSATNSLINLDLAAAQYGTKKEVGSSENKIIDRTFEIIKVQEGTSTITLKHTPVEDIQWIYLMNNNDIATAYGPASEASPTEFVMGEGGTITLPTGLTGRVYVEYKFENENAVRVVNKSSNFPEACSAVIYAYFRDKCNENLVYSGKIIINKAKLNPESIELALTSTGKHAFEMKIQKDYCMDEEDDELFSIIVSEE